MARRGLLGAGGALARLSSIERYAWIEPQGLRRSEQGLHRFEPHEAQREGGHAVQQWHEEVAL